MLNTSAFDCIGQQDRPAASETMEPGTHFGEFITQFRQMLPANTATAQAIDQHANWDQIAMKAIDDGYIECVDEFVRFVETCLRRAT